MPRKKKPQKVDTVRGQGYEIDIMLDRDTLEFFANLPGDEVITSKEARSIKSQTLAWLSNNITFDWHPIIAVDETRPFMESNTSPTRGFVGFSLSRFYWTRRQDGRVFKKEWNYGNKSNLDGASLWYAIEIDDNGFPVHDSTHYMPYSDELWEGLLGLIGKIQELKLNLSNFLSSDEGVSRLSEIGMSSIKSLFSGEDDE